jgi:hypothetical protein
MSRQEKVDEYLKAIKGTHTGRLMKAMMFREPPRKDPEPEEDSPETKTAS